MYLKNRTGNIILKDEWSNDSKTQLLNCPKLKGQVACLKLARSDTKNRQPSSRTA